MSASNAVPASAPLVTTITNETLQYAPAVIAGIQAAELTGATGQSKQAAVVSSVLNGVEVGSGVLESSPNPTVAGVALLVNMFVSIFKALNFGPFKQSPAVAAATSGGAA